MDRRKLIFIIWVPIIILGLLNLLTVFCPEIGFDALWYHLTLPKLWLLKHQWYYKGGLLYYSAMPRLAETIFIPLINFTGYIGPKLVQYLSGIGIGILIWKITSRLKFSVILKSIAISLFYCTWLVSWQSGSAYIDLFRTLLETCALYFLLSNSWLKGGLFLGLAVGTKWLSLASVGIFILVFGLPLAIPALFLSAPWFLIAYQYTSNPLYPIFSPILHQSFIPIETAIKNVVLLPLVATFPFDDFISPVIGILIVLSTATIFSRNKTIQKIAIIGTLGSISSVVLNPPSSRFLLPYLPALVIASVYLVNKLKDNLKNIFIIIALSSSVLVLILRCFAFAKYLPFITGQQTSNEFLTSTAKRLPNTFIDTDNFVQNQLPSNSKILIDKLHNLYYFPYNFDHSSWVDTWANYDYLITTGTNPKEVVGKLIHTNDIGIQIYKLNP